MSAVIARATTIAVRRILFMRNTPFRRTANRKIAQLCRRTGAAGFEDCSAMAGVTGDERDRRCRIPPG
jgi:hypothetical protein